MGNVRHEETKVVVAAIGEGHQQELYIVFGKGIQAIPTCDLSEDDSLLPTNLILLPSYVFWFFYQCTAKIQMANDPFINSKEVSLFGKMARQRMEMKGDTENQHWGQEIFQYPTNSMCNQSRKQETYIHSEHFCTLLRKCFYKIIFIKFYFVHYQYLLFYIDIYNIGSSVLGIINGQVPFSIQKVVYFLNTDPKKITNRHMKKYLLSLLTR